MENKKLLNFLLKDIAEIEELFAEKGGNGFDEYEMEFLRSRFDGSKKIIHILNEKVEEVESPLSHKIVEEEIPVHSSLEGKEEVIELVIDKAQPLIDRHKEEEEIADARDDEVPSEDENAEEDEINVQNTIAQELEEPEEVDGEAEDKSLEEPQRLGDRFVKEKSLNDLLANGSDKLENKLSNTPVGSLQGAIGINDRYIYIRELFNGSAETFSKTVADLDKLQNIQEAVAYLQQNYKWKKNDASLKFVNLVKRRFPNG